MESSELEKLLRILRERGAESSFARYMLANPSVLQQQIKEALAWNERQRAQTRGRQLEGSITERLEMVRAWPDILEIVNGVSAFDVVLKEAKDRIARFEHERKVRPLLRLVVTPYGPTAESTIRYVLGRTPGFGMEFLDVQAQRYPDFTLEYRPSVRAFANCVRIEVIDFGAYWQPSKGFDSSKVLDPNFAHVGAIAAFAQYPLSMNLHEDSYSQAFENRGKPITIPAGDVPFVEIGGLQLNVYGTKRPGPSEIGYDNNDPRVIARGGKQDRWHSLCLNVSARHAQVSRYFLALGVRSRKEPTMPTRLWE